MRKGWFTVVAEEFNTRWHKFGLINFESNSLETNKAFDHMSFDFFYSDFWVILHDKFDFFLLFFFYLNDVTVPDQAEAFNDFISFGWKTKEDFSKNFGDFVSVHLYKSSI